MPKSNTFSNPATDLSLAFFGSFGLFVFTGVKSRNKTKLADNFGWLKLGNKNDENQTLLNV